MKIAIKVLYVILMVILLLGVGTIYFHDKEGWSYTDSFYFSTMTLTTIGYGDLVPTTNATKIFTSGYAILGMGIMFYLIMTIVGGYVFKQEKYFDKIISRLRKLRKRKKEENVQKNKVKRVSGKH